MTGVETDLEAVLDEWVIGGLLLSSRVASEMIRSWSGTSEATLLAVETEAAVVGELPGYGVDEAFDTIS